MENLISLVRRSFFSRSWRSAVRDSISFSQSMESRMMRNWKMVDALPLKDVRVVFQGVEGAYSYAAMREYFQDDIESFHVKTWRDAMEAVVEGRADYAVLPIENTTAGIVADIYDLLTEYELSIVGEQIIRPEHVLLGLPDAELEDIRQVCSHPQALSQCGKYLESHPDWKKKEMENTAGSAKKIKKTMTRRRLLLPADRQESFTD